MLPKFIFVHVPKCAGTSFRENVLKPIYKGKFYYDKTMTLSKKEKAYNIKNDLMLYNWDTPVFPENYEDYDVIGGHFAFEKYAHLNVPMITFLREPIDRIISHYHFYRDADRFYMDKSIVEFSKIYANFMTRQIGNLNKLAFVGLTEYYDESVKRFADQFGLDLPKNRNKKHREDKVVHTITDEERKVIKELNKDDYELYSRVLGMYKISELDGD